MVETGDRIAQLLITPFAARAAPGRGARRHERGAGGFGSTGLVAIAG